jgi:hypothetical protein
MTLERRVHDDSVVWSHYVQHSVTGCETVLVRKLFQAGGLLAQHYNIRLTTVNTVTVQLLACHFLLL